MKKKMMIFLAFVAVFLISGCMVTKGTYQVKVDENDVLKRQTVNQKIMLEKERKTNEKLTADIADLNSILKAKSDDLSKKISEQREKITRLETENDTLNKNLAELRKSKEEIQQVSKTYGEMVEKMKSEVAQGQITITELKGKLTLNMVESILFDSGKAEVKSDGLKVLGRVVEVLKTVDDKAIRIEGHTDNIKIKGALTHKYPTNWELSAARAINVTRFLQDQGLNPAVLSTSAFGEYKPIASNDTSEGRAKNRRIEIILVPKE